MQLCQEELSPESEQCLGLLEELIGISHCGHHRKYAIAALEKWKTTNSTSLPADQAPVFNDAQAMDGDKHPSFCVITQVADTVLRKPDTADDTASKVMVTAHVHVEEIADDISTTTVSVSSEEDTPEKEQTTEKHFNTASTPDGSEKINGLGWASLQRKGSVRDNSPIFTEMHAALSPMQQEYGILYVLEHDTQEGLFKIGWTRMTAEKRLNQANNCFKHNSTPIYETRDGPFFAALKAEKLTQLALRRHNIRISVCEKCGGGHKEWFKASRDSVLETVQAMERFVKLPAYELVDGLWKLSGPVYDNVVKASCSFSPERLMGLMGSLSPGLQPIAETPPSLPIRSKPEAVAHGTDAIESQDSQELSQVSEVADSSLVARDGNDAASRRRAMRSVMKGYIKEEAKRALDNGVTWYKSRRSSQGLDSEGKEGDFKASGQDDSSVIKAQEALFGVLWTLLPENDRPKAGDGNPAEPRNRLSASAGVQYLMSTWKWGRAMWN
ncbi:hypothetical protein CPLU01_06401 [Colletotrichum plurivorum]|uniref:Bacteriophage T5 Orf172 DNA-binding domain-containing protein n=1 Tax=Colletotrichum plurivorum TaxID=2175906 RepID=A0A8H6KIA7_9PEZI|nr:hypothetical protein CPLU01_06401 [Colletotrichum plurivorum]